MTRNLTGTTEVTATVVGHLPTSRFAAHPELGVIASLRNLAPRRPLSLADAALVAERQAEHLLRLARIRSAPTPNALISELPRIVVKLDASLPVSGTTVWANGRWLIAIRSTEPQPRQRFSLAHELKHAIDHRWRAKLYQDDEHSAAEQAELAADAFAAALLMPAALVRAAWNRERDIAKLAERFQVSPRAMTRRLATLGLRADTPVTEPLREAA